MKTYMRFCVSLSVAGHKSERKVFGTHDVERNQIHFRPNTVSHKPHGFYGNSNDESRRTRIIFIQ
jgi:hypothetical protein